MEFVGGTYKETMIWDEEQILMLRELGKNDPSKRGIRQHLDLGINKLNARIEARMEQLRWQALLKGTWTFKGRVISFGQPSDHQVVPSVLWSANGVDENDSADPVRDLRYWLTGGYAPFRKYKFGRAVMNGNTARWILENANVQLLVKTRFSADAMSKYSLEEIFGFLLPGLPPITIYNGWYQDETYTNGKPVVSDAKYFVDDGYIFFEPSNLNGDKLGEMVQGIHLADGTIDQPGVGKFLAIEECIAPGTRGGPKNPFIEATGGFYGAPKLDRAFDVCTAKVIA
jgi:hypothetical protein